MSRLSDPVPSAPGLLSPELRSAFELLLQAYKYAEDCERDPWDFAVEAAELTGAGLTTADLRWLFCKGYVQHAIELTKPGAKSRRYSKPGGFLFPAKSCFVLTQAGVLAASALQAETASSTTGTPYWDDRDHTLFWGSRVLKHFRHEAPNQEAILRIFQAALWCRCVAVSLPEDVGVVSPKERLHFTIKNLNRNVRPHLRFRQEGCGSRVMWESFHSELPQPNHNTVST
jgi:hypothetical protein